jgi:hypothetical protein
VLGEFSYGDIVMAQVLQFVEPQGAPYFPVGPATRHCLREEELAREFSDLARWRDRIYEKHRATADRGE